MKRALIMSVKCRLLVNAPFQLHSSPLGINTINLDASEDTDDGEPKSRTYATRYTNLENEIFAQSRVNINKDSVVDNAQEMDAM